MPIVLVIPSSYLAKDSSPMVLVHSIFFLMVPSGHCRHHPHGPLTHPPVSSTTKVLLFSIAPSISATGQRKRSVSSRTSFGPGFSKRDSKSRSQRRKVLFETSGHGQGRSHHRVTTCHSCAQRTGKRLTSDLFPNFELDGHVFVLVIIII